MNFKEKVQAMSAKEIILAMVESLKNPTVKVRMHSYGDVEDGICYGCAATNIIQRILGEAIPPSVLPYNVRRCRFVSADNWRFVSDFEIAIDALRRGDIRHYNDNAIDNGFALIKEIDRLPCISDSNYTDPKVLQAYIDLANAQPE